MTENAKHYSLLVLPFSFVLLRRQSTVECGLGRQLPGNQSQQQQSVDHTSSPVGAGAACADEVIGRLQQTAER